MSNSIEWVRPSGKTLITNDLPATIEFCEKSGYKLAKAEKKEVKKVSKKNKSK